MLALELQGLAHIDVGDFVAGIVNFRKGLLGFFDAAALQLRKFKAAFAVELVLDDVFRSGHSVIPVECPDQLSLVLVRRTMRILWDKAGVRVTLMARRVTTSRVIFQKPVLGAVILAGNLSNAPPW